VPNLPVSPRPTYFISAAESPDFIVFLLFTCQEKAAVLTVALSF
jgi:hypothetical protein